MRGVNMKADIWGPIAFTTFCLAVIGLFVWMLHDEDEMENVTPYDVIVFLDETETETYTGVSRHEMSFGTLKLYDENYDEIAVFKNKNIF